MRSKEEIAGLVALATKDLNQLECQALARVTEAISKGAKKFGNYQPGADRRRMLDEAIEEATDQLVYLLFLRETFEEPGGKTLEFPTQNQLLKAIFSPLSNVDSPNLPTKKQRRKR